MPMFRVIAIAWNGRRTVLNARLQFDEARAYRARQLVYARRLDGDVVIESEQFR